MMDISINKTNIIDRIINERSIKIVFQPIVTIKSNKIMILEALSRGINAEGKIISPIKLFSYAAKLDKVKELDRICIEKSLLEFNRIKDNNNNILLSINITMNSIIDNKDLTWFHKIVKKIGIDPKRIIIEILEESITDTQKLEDFVIYNRKHGYLIAIDDIGSGYSGLMRVSILKPDIIKIDKSLILDVCYKKSNQIIVKSLTDLGHRLGILVTCEGVETNEDAMKLMEIGVDLQQGYYYSKPNENIEEISKKTLNSISNTLISYKSYIENKNIERKKIRSLRIQKINNICNQLNKINRELLEEKLNEIIENDEYIEFLYVLDTKGIMITNTLIRKNHKFDNTHYIFKPANKGEDFSLKNYYMKLNSEVDVYISTPYISTATGIECVTTSKRFTTEEKIEYILCMDLSSSHNVCKLD